MGADMSLTCKVEGVGGFSLDGAEGATCAEGGPEREEALGLHRIAYSVWGVEEGGRARSQIPLLLTGSSVSLISFSLDAVTDPKRVKSALNEIAWYISAIEASYHEKMSNAKELASRYAGGQIEGVEGRVGPVIALVGCSEGGGVVDMDGASMLLEEALFSLDEAREKEERGEGCERGEEGEESMMDVDEEEAEEEGRKRKPPGTNRIIRNGNLVFFRIQDVSQLKKEIDMAVERNEAHACIRARVPVKWLLLLEELTHQEGSPAVMAYSAVASVAQKCEVVTGDGAGGLDDFLSYCHECGLLLYYKAPVLSEYVILDPAWLVTILTDLLQQKLPGNSKAIDPNEGASDEQQEAGQSRLAWKELREARLEPSLFSSLLPTTPEYPLENLLMHFGILHVYDIPSAGSEEGKKSCLLMPDALPADLGAEEPLIKLKAYFEATKPLPESFFDYLIVKLLARNMILEGEPPSLSRSSAKFTLVKDASFLIRYQCVSRRISVGIEASASSDAPSKVLSELQTAISAVKEEHFRESGLDFRTFVSSVEGCDIKNLDVLFAPQRALGDATSPGEVVSPTSLKLEAVGAERVGYAVWLPKMDVTQC